MRIVIIGDGKVGYTLTERLAAEGHDVVVIDNNPKTLAVLSDALDVITVPGNGASSAVQKEAGVEHSDLLIAVTSMDEINMICCLVGKKLGVKHTIARVRNPDYLAQLVLLKEELGLSMVVNPELSAAEEIARLLRYPSAQKIERFARGHAELVEYRIPVGSPLDSMPLKRMYQTLKAHVLVCAVRRDDDVFIPTGDFVLRAGDHIHFTTPPTELTGFFRKLNIPYHRVRDVIAIGGGRIAHYLAKALMDVGAQMKIIEKDPARAVALSEALPNALIIQGDGTDPNLLSEEGLESADAFIALTGIDEENIIMSLYAKARMPEGKVITKVDRLPFIGMLGGLGLESLIAPKTITANAIVSFVRGMQNSLGSNVEALYPMLDGKIEVLEFRIRQGAEYLSRPLRDLPIKPNLLIGCIVRRNTPIIPDGSTTIELYDSVIVISAHGSMDDFNDIFRARER